MELIWILTYEPVEQKQKITTHFMTHTEAAPRFQTVSTEKQLCYWIQMTARTHIANNIRFQNIRHYGENSLRYDR